MKSENIILIGMPSSGKSTVGRLLSQSLQIPFTDTDHLISNQAGKSPRDIVAEDGLACFLQLQEDVILRLLVEGTVIATGGSVIYSHAAMTHLKENGKVFFLKTDFDEVSERLAPGRKFARREGQDMSDVYRERLPLYEKYADFTIECSKKQPQKVAEEIIHILREQDAKNQTGT